MPIYDSRFIQQQSAESLIEENKAVSENAKREKKNFEETLREERERQAMLEDNLTDLKSKVRKILCFIFTINIDS